MKCVVALLIPALSATYAAADVVYNSMSASRPPVVVFSHEPGETSSTDELPGGFESESQSGQHIVLGGASRLVTQIDMRLTSAVFTPDVGPTVTLAMTLRIYSLSSGLPGSLLWEGSSGLQSIVVGSFGANVVPVSYFPNTLFPNDIVLAISHTQVSGQTVGLVGAAGQNEAPDVGNATSEWFSQDTASGLWSTTPSGGNIQARITAIPSPATLPVVLLALGIPTRRRPGHNR